MKGRGKREIPEKTRRPAALSGTIPACENPGVTRPGIEPDLAPASKANRAPFPAKSLPDLRMWESCRTTPLVGGFSQASPVSLGRLPLLASHRSEPGSIPGRVTGFSLVGIIKSLKGRRTSGAVSRCIEAPSPQSGPARRGTVVDEWLVNTAERCCGCAGRVVTMQLQDHETVTAIIIWYVGSHMSADEVETILNEPSFILIGTLILDTGQFALLGYLCLVFCTDECSNRRSPVAPTSRLVRHRSEVREATGDNPGNPDLGDPLERRPALLQVGRGTLGRRYTRPLTPIASRRSTPATCVSAGHARKYSEPLPLRATPPLSAGPSHRVNWADRHSRPRAITPAPACETAACDSSCGQCCV
ncbi:hypothetical protein PR048_017403 [Dryococelus australis]|uniref:Uncharacterized protein n=1 Tax=Dryococelus australis TaxID=614101 RepID=A0ABQ9H9L6_9NEOP|nr:hypothetical protein PR048_017403 [Dryococelus australis]